jgi:hypothetical protein
MHEEAGAVLSDDWFVTNGIFAAGPMTFDRLATEVARGRITSGSFIRHASWSIWHRYEELQDLSTDARNHTVARLATISASAERRANNPSSIPPPPLSSPISAMRHDSPPPISSGRPTAVNPVAVLARAGDLDAALQLTLSTAVAATRADAGFVHRYRRDLDRLVRVHGVGEGAEQQFGNRLEEDDPSVGAARAGQTLLAETPPGPGGCYVAGRFAPVLGEVRGAAMVPVVAFGKLHAMIEVGRRAASFYAREVARMEDIVEALAARGVVAGWLT